MNKIKVRDISDYLSGINLKNSIYGDQNTIVEGFSSLFNYKPGTITFIAPERNPEDYIHSFSNIQLILISKKNFKPETAKAVIHVRDTRKAFFKIIEQFFDLSINEEINCISSDCDVFNKSSYISQKAQLGNNVKIGIGCVIEGNVIIGDNTEIHHNVVIRNGSKIGKNCTIFSGTVIGERGFNYYKDENGLNQMIRHYGGVTIEDNVHIGDNSCITQGAIDDTVIKHNVKMNKMTMVAHNVIIGENTIITAATKIFGSVIIGKNCHIAASVIRNQVSIADNAILGLGSVVVKDVNPYETVIGVPARKMEK